MTTDGIERCRRHHPRGPGRGAPALPSAVLRGVLPVLLLAVSLAGGGCATGRQVPEDPTMPPEIDYQARHEHMLELVIERPVILEMQRQERERRARRDDTSAWEAVAARQKAYEESQKKRRQKSQDFYERLLERQHRHEAQRERVRTERWAQFLENNPPLPPDEGQASAGTGQTGAPGSAAPAP